jgi:hypothetical protein
VLEAEDRKQNPWARWLGRLGSTFDAAFTGTDWRERRKEFIEHLKKVGWWKGAREERGYEFLQGSIHAG